MSDPKLILQFYNLYTCNLCLQVTFYQNTTHFAMWDVQAFKGLWITQRIVLLAFWITATYSSSQVFRIKNYDPEYLLNTGR